MKNIILFITLPFILDLTADAQKVNTFTSGTPDDAIILDNQGNIYCSNYTGNSIFKFNTSGIVTSFVTGLNTPNGLAFNSNEELYVCDGQANKIYRYDKNGNPLNSYGNSGHPSGILKSHDSDTMIFTEYLGNSINTLSPDGTITEISSDPLLVGPVGLSYDENNQLYVGNFNNRKIYKVAMDGSLTYVATVGNTSNLGFIAFANGMLWGTVLGEHKIYKIDPNAIDEVEIFAGSSLGSKDGDITEATFNQPNGIQFNEEGDTLYITDFGSKNLRIVSFETALSSSDEIKNENRCTLYPNPVENVVNFQIDNSSFKHVTINVYGPLGQKIYSSKFRSSKYKIDLSTWENGNYFVKISSNDYSETKKIIKI